MHYIFGIFDEKICLIKNWLDRYRLIERQIIKDMGTQEAMPVNALPTDKACNQTITTK